MGKHTDALKSFDEFRAPWETEGGTDAEIDKPKLKRWIHGILSDKAKAQDAREDLAADLEKAKADLDSAKDEAANANGEEAQKKIDRLEKKVADLTSERDKLVADQELAELRKDVLGDLPEKYAKYVKGETREELEKSLEEIKADFDIKDTDEDADDGDDDEVEVRTRPQARTRLVNAADKNGKGGEEQVDFDAVADGIVGTSIFR